VVLQTQVPKLYTDLDLKLLYILILGTCSKFTQKHHFQALGVYFPPPYSSAGRMFTAPRSRLQYYWQIVAFPQQKFDEIRCKLDSTENPRSFEKYPTAPERGNFLKAVWGMGWSQTKTWYWFYRMRVLAGPSYPRKIFLSNYHIQKQEIVDVQKIKYEDKSKE